MSRIARSIVAVVVLVVAGGAAGRSDALPAPEELAPNTVMFVSDVPVRLGTVTMVEFRHALVLTAASKGRLPVPKRGGNGYGQLAQGAVERVLEAIWLKGQAGEMGISVSRRQVSRELVWIERETFESKAEYHRFLRKAHFTRRDVNERVELQLLSSRVQARLQTRIERQARNEFEENQAFKKFIAEFTTRWRARTVCATGYVTDRCSNGPPPESRATGKAEEG